MRGWTSLQELAIRNPWPILDTQYPAKSWMCSPLVYISTYHTLPHFPMICPWFCHMFIMNFHDFPTIWQRFPMIFPWCHMFIMFPWFSSNFATFSHDFRQISLPKISAWCHDVVQPVAEGCHGRWHRLTEEGLHQPGADPGNSGNSGYYREKWGCLYRYYEYIK